MAALWRRLGFNAGPTINKPLNQMKQQFGFASLLAGLMLAGCASGLPNGASTAPASAATAPAAAAAVPPELASKPIRVPAESAHKVALTMTGSKAVVEAKEWAGFKEEWRATFADHAKDAGIAFVWQDGPTRPAADAGTLVSVYVNDYRQVGIGARIFLGIMTGNAHIDAKVSLSNLNSGEPFGDQVYNTSSSAWAGVFAKMTPQQLDAITSEVFREIKPR